MKAKILFLLFHVQFFFAKLVWKEMKKKKHKKKKEMKSEHLL